MSEIGIISIVIIAANFIFSYKGFTNRSFYEGYSFEVDKVLLNKDYIRIISSGFLHINWTHLIFNMLTLYAFSASIEHTLGEINYLLIYFSGIIGGNLFSLFIHRNHGDYGAVGASGGVCAIIFASIALFPGLQIGFFILPVSIAAWIYGLIYVLFSIYAIKSNHDNVGHEAHLAGAILGMLIAIAMEPSSLQYNYLPILAVIIPCIAFIFIIVKKPQALLIDNYFFKQQEKFYSIDHKYNSEKVLRQKEIDAILEKIHKKGMKSLTQEERQTLAAYSEKIR
ncbi:MAG: rhomboid family intramembrane serine protease [Flavisolibacter sp.]